MSRKRRNTSSPELSDHESSHSSKRQHVFESESVDDDYESEDADVSEQPQIDPNSGMTGAFPGLSANSTDFYGPAVNGIDYLRMVRSEAKNVPPILTAIPKKYQEVRNDQQEETRRGYYYDGAYTSVSTTFPPPASPIIPPFQQKYYDRLLLRFQVMRAKLRLHTKSHRESSSRLAVFDLHSSKSLREWENEILGQDPHTGQLGQMESEVVIEIVAWIATQLERWIKSYGISAVRRIGSWIWALLARCPERGELASEEIAELRSLAQVAIRALSVNSAAMKKGKESSPQLPTKTSFGILNQGDDGASDDLPEQTTHGNNAEGNDKNAPLDRGSIELDMIITIVGELYGQRDLLSQRQMWPTVESELDYG